MALVSARRLESLDQFRGYTVAGMFVVNFLDGFRAVPPVLHHHNSYCSYADTIMPQFLFAVGFSFRLTFGRRLHAEGARGAYARVVRRLVGLVLMSLAIYTIGSDPDTWSHWGDTGLWGAIGTLAKRDWFQTLMHIAVTSLWILPVIRSGTAVRVAYLIASALLHVVLSYCFNFTWCNTEPCAIDGGPLGFLTWTIPAIVGTLACDAIQSDGAARVWRMAGWSVLLMGMGYLLSCGTRLYDVPPDRAEREAGHRLANDPVAPIHSRSAIADFREFRFAEPPFVAPPDADHRQWNYWMMSQRAGTLSYLTFAAGFSLGVYLLFYVACDLQGWQWGVFRTLGVNALAGYILHGAVGLAIHPLVPGDAPAWQVGRALAIYFLIVYAALRGLERKGIYLRL